MTNQELYKQAILDAKAVRETALAAARESLAEAFEPRIKEMMRLKLTEDMEEESKVEESADMEEAKADMEETVDMEESADMEESTLDEILAELDALSDESTVEEGKQGTTAGYPEKAHTAKGETGYDEKAKTSKGNTNGSYTDKAKSSIHEAEEDETDDDDAEVDDKAEEAGKDLTKGIEGAHDEETADDQEVVDITVGDLKDIIRDVFIQLQGGADTTGLDDLDVDSPDQAVADDAMQAGEEESEISLEEILAELEKEEEGKVEEAAKANEIPGGRIDPKAADVHKVEFDEVKKDLHEANKAIQAMKQELNEVNLLNAKLLYVNKIFKAKSLTESQKVKVLNAFDRATTVKEVENTFKTLNESIGEGSKKTSLKESVGFASKPIGTAPARPIVDADPFINRWQQLAGIK